MTDVEPLIISELEQMLPLPPADRADWEDVFRRAGLAPARHSKATRRGRFTRRRFVAAVVVALALAVPALAFSGLLDDLFGFSNQGTPFRGGMTTLHALLVTGAKPGTLVELADRDGFGVYAARAKRGDFCFYYAPPGSDPNLGGGCLHAWGVKGQFPSPSRPVWDMSSGYYLPEIPAADRPAIKTLVGVAADGVHTVQLLALSDCHAVVTVPVIDNVYIEANPPLTAVSYIVARDAGGNVIWHKAIAPGMKVPSCGLH